MANRCQKKNCDSDPRHTPRQVRKFLETAGLCRLWIPGFALLAAPLYPLTREKTPFIWGREQQQAFHAIKKALLMPRHCHYQMCLSLSPYI